MVVASSDGHSGAASATWEHVHRHFAVAALLSPKTPPIPLAGQRSPRMSILPRRAHGGITSPCCRQVEIDMRVDLWPARGTLGVLGAWGLDGPPGATGVLSRGVPPVKGVWGAASGSPPQAPIFWAFLTDFHEVWLLFFGPR